MMKNKAFKKLFKITIYSLILFLFVLVCAFYTHPTFMKENVSIYFPFIKIQKSSFIGNFGHCKEYQPITSKLNDRYVDYIWNSAYQKFGDVIVEKEEIRPYYLKKKLLLVDSSNFYVVDSLFHSYAFLTKDAKKLLDEIGAKFKKKLKNTTLRDTRIIVTSLLRTEKTVRSLMRINRNSIKISSHLHGTTFDIAHDEFAAKKNLNTNEIDYLKDVLAQTLFEFRKKDRCYVTYEIQQACFHVVNKKI